MKNRLIYIILLISISLNSSAQSFPYVFTDFNQNYTYNSNIGTHDRVLFDFGQSNALGSAPDCDSTDLGFDLLYLRRHIQDAWIMDENYKIDSIKLGGNTACPRNYDPYYLDNFGMEVEYARLSQSYYKDNFSTFIYKHAWGGQPIHEFLPGGIYYNTIISHADSLLNYINFNRDNPIIFYWDQGEKNAIYNLDSANVYDQRLEELLISFSTDLNLTNVTFIMREMIIYTSWRYIREIISAQRRFAASRDNVYLIRSDDLVLGDIYHINAASQCEMARRVFEIAKTKYR